MSINDGNIVLSPGEGKIVPVPGHKVTHKVVGADTDGAYSLLEVELVGDGPPQHIHKTEDEAFYVLVLPSINTVIFAEGACEARSRSEKEAMSGHRRRRATKRSTTTSLRPKGCGVAPPSSSLLLLADIPYRLVGAP